MSLAVFAIPVLAMLSATPAEPSNPPDYLRDVKPLLASRCWACHGALKQEAGLRLDTADFLRTGGDSGPAIAPGEPDQSLLIDRIQEQDPDSRMPPSDGGTPLEPQEVAILKRWIESGAHAPADEQPEADPADHWAFRPVVAPSAPTNVPQHADSMIDAWLASAPASTEIPLQPPADPGILLRRVYLDLIGLPPTLDQLERFRNDSRPDAYERVVDSLLASPAHAERWARHWMDIWRYSDWWGLGADLRNSQKHIWHWRDWILDSLNTDAGYDEMVRQMLAADELHPNDLDQLRATGYLARQYFKFNRNTWLDDTLEHTAKAFLGLTMNCAKCHDHKYDPIAQSDYYSLRAFFEPYQIRTEILPNSVDVEHDGIPRAFDCNLDKPTYLFTRGDEKQPETDHRMSPALPSILTAALPLPEIAPVPLPPEAHHPGLRPHVLERHLQLARQTRKDARATHRAALATLASTAMTPAAPLLATRFVSEPFAFFHPGPGDWTQHEQCLQQRQTGNDYARLEGNFEVPNDFQARLRFIPHDGQTWKSVGLSFDVHSGREIFVYLSATEKAPKLQVGYTIDNKPTYPNDAQLKYNVELGKPHELLVQVRGSQLNVHINGQFELAWTIPTERLPGRLDLWTYDAQADFLEFELARLQGDALPNGLALAPVVTATPEQAQAAADAAQRMLDHAEAEPDLLQAVVAADRARFGLDPSADPASLASKAASLQREQSLRKARADLALHQSQSLAATAAQRKDLDAKIEADKKNIERAQQSIQSQSDQYTSLSGARKSPESNLEDEASLSKPFPTKSTGRRSALARWMTDPRNPLTARVAVNHIWTRHFGSPIVETIFDFGRKGANPSHPELLDGLAADFTQNGWQMKRLHRQMVTSTTYRLAGRDETSELSADPENKLYRRRSPLRMESQIVRDATLALAGELQFQFGGAPVPLSEQQSSRRRSLYFVHSHNDQHRFLGQFDDANVLQCYRRSESVVPQQALALVNSKLTIDAAAKIAAQFEHCSDADFVRAAFEAILATPPDSEEQALCQETLDQVMAQHADQSPDFARRRARIALVHAILNHNDFVTIR